MTVPPRLTAAQQRALDWLNRDGSWKRKRHNKDVPFYDLYSLCTVGLAEARYRDEYRLTPTGLAMFHSEPESEER